MIPRKESKGVLREAFSFFFFSLISSFFTWLGHISFSFGRGTYHDSVMTVLDRLLRGLFFSFFILLSFEQPQAKNKNAGSLRANDNVLEHFLDTKESKDVRLGHDGSLTIHLTGFG
jgi:hypothetical protein